MFQSFTSHRSSLSRTVLIALCMVTALLSSRCLAQEIIVSGRGAAPIDVKLTDVPNDAGNGFHVTWKPSVEPGFTIFGYEVLMAKAPADSFVSVATTSPTVREAEVLSSEQFEITAGTDYYGKVVALDSTIIAVPETLATDSVTMRLMKRLRRSESAVIGPVQTQASWFNTGRISVLVLILLFFSLVLCMLRQARRGKELRFRRIAGIDAIEEAIGRATELGKPILYIPGTQNIENIQTIASLQLLTSVASKAATYDIPIIVPLNRAFMVTVAEESVKQGYLNAGRLDAYNRDNIRYLSDEQFAFTSGVTGIMMREKTAAHLYLGAFFGESLILSETGFSTGAIQIAGTANVHQLPFFVVACDYTLIGEEYFATSGLVTRNPELLGTLKATDWVKAVLITALSIAAVLELFGVTFIRSWFTIP